MNPLHSTPYHQQFKDSGVDFKFPESATLHLKDFRRKFNFNI